MRARTIQIVEGKATSEDIEGEIKDAIQASSAPETAASESQPTEPKTQPVTTPALAENKKGDSQDWLQPKEETADDQDKYRAPF